MLLQRVSSTVSEDQWCGLSSPILENEMPLLSRKVVPKDVLYTIIIVVASGQYFVKVCFFGFFFSNRNSNTKKTACRLTDIIQAWWLTWTNHLLQHLGMCCYREIIHNEMLLCGIIQCTVQYTGLVVAQWLRCWTSLWKLYNWGKYKSLWMRANAIL